MTLLTNGHPISKSKGKIPLCLVLVVPFVLQIFVAVGLTGWLSLRNGQKDVNDLASQLKNEITAHIRQQITTYIETPQIVAQINADAVRLSELNLQNSGSLERHFWHQMQLFKSLRPIAFGNEQGEIRSVDRLDDGTLVIRAVDKSTGGNYHTYATDNQGNRSKLIKVDKIFDPRTRPWYKAAVKAGKLTWSEIYPYFSSPSLAISAVRPFYDNRTGTLLGVTNATLSLSQVGDFLHDLKIGRSGQTFIVERSGDLVASSTTEKPFTISKEGKEEKRRRLQALHSSNRLTRLTAQYLIERFGDLSRINGSQQLDFKIEGKRQFLQVTPLADAHGLDWVIVVVVPEDDFMQQINANTRTTILLCLLALVLATLLGILTARWISRPILRLSQASSGLAKRVATSDFASSQLYQKVEVEGINELELLAQSFNQMAQQLQESFAAQERTNEALSFSEKRFRLAVDHFPDTFVIYDANRRFQFVNAHGVRLGGLPESALLGHTDEEIHPPEITDAYLPHLLKAVETRTSQTAECTITLPTIGQITFVVTYVPLLDERGEIYQILGITHDITERKLTQEKLQAQHEFLQTILDTNPNLIFVKDREGNYLLCNQALSDFFGINVENLIGLTDAQLHPNQADVKRFIDQDQEVFATLQQKFISEEPYHTWTGEVQWFQTLKKPIFSTDGQVCQVLGVATNITQRKIAEIQIQESLREKEVLLQEIHHRVKNNLQVISSLLDLQSQHIEEQATLELFRQSCNRIRAMALVHETLYKFKDFAKINFAEYIENLTSYLFTAYGVNVENINLELRIDEVTLKLDTAIPCGLIINELVSNALKHAFPNKEGTIYIALHFDEDKHSTLTIKDNGIGLPQNWEVTAVNSLGLKLVKILAKQLEGTLQVNSSFGTEFSLRFSELS
jgi:PAS domain S-box-containing protein